MKPVTEYSLRVEIQVIMDQERNSDDSEAQKWAGGFPAGVGDRLRVEQVPMLHSGLVLQCPALPGTATCQAGLSEGGEAGASKRCVYQRGWLGRSPSRERREEVRPRSAQLAQVGGVRSGPATSWGALGLREHPGPGVEVSLRLQVGRKGVGRGVRTGVEQIRVHTFLLGRLGPGRLWEAVRGL